jgi:hypothetical protein
MNASPQGCKHVETKRGRREPTVWGSWPTEVCVTCGAKRTLGHVVGPWKAKRLPVGSHAHRSDNAAPEGALRQQRAVAECSAQPPSTNAIDPHAQLSGTPSTRAKNSSFIHD